MKRTLSMLLVLSLLLSCLPLGALATEVETVPAETIVEVAEVTEAPVEETEAAVVETAEVMETITDVEVIEEPIGLAASDSLWQDDWGNWNFSDFEGLKQLVAMDITDWTNASYQGTEPLVISEDLRLPANLYITADDDAVIIPAGVTFIINDNFTVKDLTVEGTAYIAYLNIYGTLKVTGTLYPEAVSLWNDAVCEGAENVVFPYGGTSFSRIYDDIVTAEALQEILAKANSSTDYYSVNIHGQITLTEDATIPSNCGVNMGYNQADEYLAVAAGATLTLDGNLSLATQLIVNGALVNNRDLSLSPNKGQTALTVGATGSYSGNGTISINKNFADTYSDIISGLDLSGFSVSEDEWDWELRILPDGPQQNEWGGWEIFDFDDLKQLAAMDHSDYVSVSYEGGEPLVISEDLSLPETIYMNLYNQPMVINEGVTFTMRNSLSVDDLTVNGTLICGYLGVSGDLTVNGTIQSSSSISLGETSTLSGQENIQFTNEWSYLNLSRPITDTASLKAAVAEVNAETDPHIRYELSFTDGATVTESVTIPANCYISSSYQSTVTIAAGAVLTMNESQYSSHSINGNMVIYGELVNNGRLAIYQSGVTLTVADGGKYSGTGVLQISNNDPKAVLQGVNWDDYEAIAYGEEWEVRYVAGLIKLATPTDLDWGIRHDYWVWDEDAQDWVLKDTSFPGAISWKPAEPTLAHGRIQVYRADDNTQVYNSSWYFGSTDLPEWRTVEDFAMSDPESGTYYFTVTAEGDYTQYRDSDPARSPNWTYVKPNAKLGTCTDITWNWPEASFTVTGDTTYYGGYEYQVLFSPNETWEPEICGWGWSYYTDGLPGVWDEAIMNCGVGYYYMKVRPLSSDITKACNGDWSELSPAYNLTEVVEKVENQLDNILQNSENLTEKEVREAVQALDTQQLKDSLLAEDAVQQQIAILEEQVGGPAPVAVSNEVAMDASEVSVVGANLNNAASADEDIKLVIDKPEENHVLEAAYDNSVAFKFSMTLDNVEDAKDLDVPVRITMPVPAGVNPEFLVILHYHAGQEKPEEVGPDRYELSYQGGKAYVSFVVTSFSDFIITQYKPECDHKWDNGKVTKEPTATEDGVKTYTCTTCEETKTEVIPATGVKTVWGDADGDGDADYVDSMMIAQYDVFLLEDHEINLANCDVDGNGFVDYVDSMLVAQYDVFLFDKFPVELES